jgi:hypothetical protein
VDETTSVDWETIGQAIVVFTGWGHASWPSRDEKRVIERFGPEAAERLLPLVRRYHAAFMASQAQSRASDLVEIGAMATEEFVRDHPLVPPDALAALAWSYTFDCK